MAQLTLGHVDLPAPTADLVWGQGPLRHLQMYLPIPLRSLFHGANNPLSFFSCVRAGALQILLMLRVWRGSKRDSPALASWGYKYVTT